MAAPAPSTQTIAQIITFLGDNAGAALGGDLTLIPDWLSYWVTLRLKNPTAGTFAGRSFTLDQLQGIADKIIAKNEQIYIRTLNGAGGRANMVRARLDGIGGMS